MTTLFVSFPRCRANPAATLWRLGFWQFTRDTYLALSESWRTIRAILGI